jgi:hypothetical protein
MQQKSLVLVLLLACFLTVSAVSGAQSSTIPLNQAVRTQIISCSANVAPSPSGMGQVSFTSTPAGATVILDGTTLTYTTDPLPGQGGFPSIPSMTLPYYTPFTANMSTGSHTIRFWYQDPNTYAELASGTYNIPVCAQRVTYLSSTLSAVPTQTTVVPTTTIVTAAPVTSTPVTSAPVTGTTTLQVSTTTVSPGSSTASPTISQVPAPSGSPVSMASDPEKSSGQGSSGTATSVTTGVLSVTTTPSGAIVMIDGIQRGISPATISGLSPGSHTILLKLEGYADLSSPVSIMAGQTQEYSTGLAPVSGPTQAPGPTATKTPGFGALLAISAVGALFLLHTIKPQ